MPHSSVVFLPRSPTSETRYVERTGIHGAQAFNRESDGRYRCSRCNADAVYRRKVKLKTELVAAAGGKCKLCGYNKSVRAMHFHHRDRATKLFDLSKMTSYSIPLVREEAAKCDLLCANCHAEVEEQIWTHGAMGAHLVYTEGVVGSSPTVSTTVL